MSGNNDKVNPILGHICQYYNDSVLGLNNKIQMFPSNLIASMTGFNAGEFFQVTAAEEREAPKVSFP